VRTTRQAAALAVVVPSVARRGAACAQRAPADNPHGPGRAAAARGAVEDLGGTVPGAPVGVGVSDSRYKPDFAATTARAWFRRQPRGPHS
jgi:hypothetical protein